MEIQVKTDEELTRLLDVLASEITIAHNNYQLNKNLSESVSANSEVFNESNTFWYLTTKALLDAALTQLCRVYDQNSKALNLVNLLDTIKTNQDRFSEKSFKERLVDNAFVDSLAKANRSLSTVELENDRKKTSCENETVKKLMKWRNNIIAHRGADVALDRSKLIENNPLSYTEIEGLISEALAIYNKYSSLFRASTHAPNMTGHEDYRSVLKFMKIGLEKYKQDRDAK